jgi:hypothetical protein
LALAPTISPANSRRAASRAASRATSAASYRRPPSRHIAASGTTDHWILWLRAPGGLDWGHTASRSSSTRRAASATRASSCCAARAACVVGRGRAARLAKYDTRTSWQSKGPPAAPPARPRSRAQAPPARAPPPDTNHGA